MTIPEFTAGACVSSRKDHYRATLAPTSQPGSLSLPRTRMPEVLHRGQFRPCLVQVHLQRAWGETLWKRKLERTAFVSREVSFRGEGRFGGGLIGTAACASEYPWDRVIGFELIDQQTGPRGKLVTGSAHPR